MTNRRDYGDRRHSDASWILVDLVDDEPFSKTRKPQLKDCNRVEQGASTSGPPVPPHPIPDPEKEDNYNPFQHYPGSLESGQTDATVRPADNAEAPHEPLILQEPEPVAAQNVPVLNLEPLLLQLPQHTQKDIRGWLAGEDAPYIPYATTQESVQVEHGSANTTSSASHSRAGMHMISADVAVMGMGMWSSDHPRLGMSEMTISNDSSNFGSNYHWSQ